VTAVGATGNYGNVSYASYLSRASFLLNDETYSGKKLKIGDEIYLPLKDERKAKFVYACDVDGEKLMLAADDMLSEKTIYGRRSSAYETSDVRKFMKLTETRFTPEALALMLPCEVRGNDVIPIEPAQIANHEKAEEKNSNGGTIAQGKRSFAIISADDPKFEDLTIKEFVTYKEYTIQKAARAMEFVEAVQNDSSFESVQSALAKFNSQEQGAQTPQVKSILEKIKKKSITSANAKLESQEQPAKKHNKSNKRSK
jgi:hypothetical protein